MEIMLNGPKTLTLSPATIAAALDALANHGPYRVVDPAIKEIFSELQKVPQSDSGTKDPSTGDPDVISGKGDRQADSNPT